jgi:uncharacterized SAM-binding protein YcdF (DUF218 family)
MRVDRVIARSLHALVLSLTYPPVLSALLLACAAVAVFLHRRKLAGGLAAVAIAWSLLWSVPACSDQLRRTLEQRAPLVQEASLPAADAIVVLGGGSSYTWLERADVEASDLSSSRLAAGARAWLAGRAPVVILSGGGRPGHTEAGNMARAITRLGVPPSALLLEQRSRNTRQNAEFTARLAQPQAIHRILLVTSALHMPRASALFRAAGFAVTPVPVPEIARRGGWADRWVPSPGALWRSGRAMKEYAGLLQVQVDRIGARGDRSPSARRCAGTPVGAKAPISHHERGAPLYAHGAVTLRTDAFTDKQARTSHWLGRARQTTGMVAPDA